MHNKICKDIRKSFPKLNDEKVFQETKRRCIAYYQNIIFNEYLPVTLGIDMGPY